MFFYELKNVRTNNPTWTTAAKKVASDWNYKAVAAASDGSFFGMKSNGSLDYHKFGGFSQNGAPLWKTQNGFGSNWGFSHIIAVGSSSLCGLSKDGRLFYYNYTKNRDGSLSWNVAGKKIGSGSSVRNLAALAN